MALPEDRRQALLTVIEGGRQDWRGEEARTELLAFFAEVENDATEIMALEAGMRVPMLRVIHLAGRLGYRASEARREYLALTAPEPEGAA